MSQENVELVRGLQPAADEDIVPWFRDDAVTAELTADIGRYFTPDFTTVLVLPLETSTHHGPDGLVEAWREWLAPWSSYRADVDEVVDLGARVLVLTRDRGRRVDMDAEVVNQEAAAIYTFDGAKICQVEFYASRAQALDVAGLAP